MPRTSSNHLERPPPSPGASADRRRLVRLRAKRYGETSTKLDERSRGGDSRTSANPLEPVRTSPNLLEPVRASSNQFDPSRTAKRDAILAAAIEVFARRGYFGAQVADIARAAGVAAGTVYLYFRSKDDLLVSIFDKTMKEAREEGRAALQGVADPVERLRRIARLHLDRLGRDRNLAVVFQVELRQSTKFMERFSTSDLRDYLGIIRDTIAHGQETGAFRKGIKPTLAAKMFFGALDEMATNWILSNRRYTLAADVDSIVDLFVNGLGVGKKGMSRQ